MPAPNATQRLAAAVNRPCAATPDVSSGAGITQRLALLAAGQRTN